MGSHSIRRRLVCSSRLVFALATTGCSSSPSGSTCSKSGASNGVSASAGTSTLDASGAKPLTGISLVIHFSRGGESYWRGGRKVLSQGNTAILAKEIAAQTGADAYEILPARPYSSDYADAVARNVREEQEN